MGVERKAVMPRRSLCRYVIGVGGGLALGLFLAASSSAQQTQADSASPRGRRAILTRSDVEMKVYHPESGSTVIKSGAASSVGIVRVTLPILLIVSLEV